MEKAETARFGEPRDGGRPVCPASGAQNSGMFVRGVKTAKLVKIF
jgi:hypothetical protein